MSVDDRRAPALRQAQPSSMPVFVPLLREYLRHGGVIASPSLDEVSNELGKSRAWLHRVATNSLADLGRESRFSTAELRAVDSADAIAALLDHYPKTKGSVVPELREAVLLSALSPSP